MIRAEWTNDDALTTGQATKANDSNTLNALESLWMPLPKDTKERYEKTKKREERKDAIH